jgi:hypothetical protein
MWNGSNKSAASGGESALWYTRGKVPAADFERERNLIGLTSHLDGGGSVAADKQGNVFVVWHGHPGKGIADELHRRVFVARSTDDGQNFEAEQPVNSDNSGACGCCGLKAFADSRGRLSILYRDASEAGMRDMTLLVSENHGLTFEARVVGPWKAATCPMSTQSLSEGPQGSLLGAFETAAQVFKVVVPANWRGEPIIPEAPSGSPGTRKHPALLASAASAKSSLLVWTEGTGWARGGSLAWEWTDSNSGKKVRGAAAGVPVWGGVTAVAESDGGFTVIY